MAFAERIQGLFDIRPEESWTVGRILLFSFFQSLGLAFLYTTANVLFLSGGQDEIQTLPFVYISAALMLLLLELVFQRMEKFMPVSHIILVTLVVLMLSVGAFGFALQSGQKPMALIFLLIVWEKISALTANSEFGKINAMIFDIRQSKRLFGLLGSAEIPARILGVLVAPWLLNFTPSIGNLLFISTGLFLISIVFYLQIVGRHKKDLAVIIRHHEGEAVANRITFRQAIKKFFGSRYIMLLSALFFCAVAASTFIEFSFLTAIEAFSNSAIGNATKETQNQNLAYLLGIFLSLGEGANFLMKTFFSGRLINRYGIKFALRILPAGLFVGALLFFITTQESFQQFHVWVIAFMMLYNMVVRSSLADPGFFSLFQPLNQRDRFEGYNTVGMVENVALGLAGIMLLSLNWIAVDPGVRSVLFIALLLFVLVGSLISSVIINNEYQGILENALKNRSFEGQTLDLQDGSSADLLRRKLGSEHLGEVLYALDLLAKFGHASLSEEIPRMLQHTELEVRMETLRLIEKYRLSAYAPLVRQMMVNSAHPRMQSMAITVYTSIAEEDFFEEIIPLLANVHEEVKMGAMIGLIRSGGISGVIAAGERLIELSTSISEKDRIFAAFIVGEVGIQNFYQPLLRLMEDPSPEVRKAAMEAAGKIKNSRLAKSLTDRLGEGKVFEAASRSLIRMGDLALPYLQAAMDPSAIGDWRKPRRAAYVSGRIGGSHAIALLKERLSMKAPEIRNQVLESLGSNTFHASDMEMNDIHRYIRRELEEATFMLYAMKLLKDQNTGLLLFGALDNEVRQSINRLMLLLSFVYKAQTIRQVRQHFFGGDKEKRANAIEMLDVVITGALKWQLFPLLEDLPLLQKADKMIQQFPQQNIDLPQVVAQILSPNCDFLNAWTKATALHLVNENPTWAMESVLQANIYFGHPLVAETACWVLGQIDPDLLLQMRQEEANSEIKKLMAAVIKNMNNRETKSKLFLIEKILLLKTVSIFSHTSEEILAEIAAIAEEVEVKKDESIFYKGDNGDCMYIIYRGEVRVHDGEHTFARFKERDFFGELSLLDPEPRSATVTATVDTFLLKLTQETFYEIMADRIEVVRGILRILVQRLRKQNQQISSKLTQEAEEE